MDDPAVKNSQQTYAIEMFERYNLKRFALEDLKTLEKTVQKQAYGPDQTNKERWVAMYFRIKNEVLFREGGKK